MVNTLELRGIALPAKYLTVFLVELIMLLTLSW